MIDRIEVFVTELPVRLKRIFSSGSYDTGPPKQLLSKPVLVKIHADGVVGCAQIRPISPGHFVADTTHSVVAAIVEIYGPGMLGKQLFDIESINEAFDARLAGNPAARAVLAQLEAAAGAHFYASTPLKRMFGAGEFLFGLNTTAPDPLVPETTFVVRDGHVDVPTGPGLGIVIDEAALRKHTLKQESIG